MGVAEADFWDLSALDVAGILGVCRQTVYRIDEGELVFMYVNGVRRYSRRHLRNYIRRNLPDAVQAEGIEVLPD